MKINLLLTFLLPVCLVSAQPRTMLSLSPSEVALAQNIGFSTEVMLLLRMKTDAPFQHFFVEDGPIWVNDSVVGHADRFVDGLLVDVSFGLADSILYELSDLFWERGYHVFRTVDNFGNGPDQLGILQTNDPFEVLQVVGTEGLNYGYDQMWVMAYARKIFQKHPFHISGAGREWMEAMLLEPPSDYLEFARELASTCPDLVEDGTGTVEQLAQEIQESGLFYLWWD